MTVLTNKWHTFSYASSDGSFVHAELSSPFGVCEHFAVFGVPFVGSPISPLLKVGRPLAVSRLVIAIIIDAIKGQALNVSRKHVLYEHVGVHPSRTHSNSAPSIAAVMSMRSRETSHHHSFPYREQWVERETVGGISFELSPLLLGSVASTACGGRPSKVGQSGARNIAALALTNCINKATARFPKSENRKSSKHISNFRDAGIAGYEAVFRNVYHVRKSALT